MKVLDEAGLITRRKQGRTTYLTLNRRPLAQLQQWVNQFHPYWGSDEATYENYSTYLQDDAHTEPGLTTHPRETR